MRRRLLPLLFLAPLLAVPARADEDEFENERDSARARAAVEAGEIRPLSQLLARIEARYAGRVIATELEHEHDRWIYTFKLLPEAGHIFSVELDAASGKVVSTRGPVQEKR